MLSSDIVDRYIFCTLDLVKYRRFLKMYNCVRAANILFLDYGEDYYSSLEHPNKTKAWLNAEDIKDLIMEVVVDKKVTMKLFNKPGNNTNNYLYIWSINTNTTIYNRNIKKFDYEIEELLSILVTGPCPINFTDSINILPCSREKAKAEEILKIFFEMP